MPSRDLKVTLLGEDKTSGAFRSASGNAEGFHSKLSSVGKGLALAFGGAALAGVAGVGAAFIQGVKDAASYQKVTDQVAQTIKSTGNAAGVSIGGLKDYAGQLESMSGVDEELILKGQNVLLTFTGIHNEVGKGNDIFNQASLAASNLSATMGTDLASANTLVGKALNDPIKGLTALQRVGVSFSAQQKEQIATMVKSGDTMGAQKVILGELNKEFGGAAKAAGSGLTGSLARAKDAFQDMFRNIATALLPTLAKLAEYVANTLIPGIKSMAAWIARNKEPIETIAKVVGAVLLPVLAAWGAASVVNAAKSVGAWFAAAFASTAGAAAQERSALQVGLSWLVMGAKAVVEGGRIAAVWVAQIAASAVSGAAAFVVQVAKVVAGWVVMGVQSLIQAARMAAAWVIAMGPVGWVIAAVVGLVALIVTHWKTVVSWTTTAWHAVTSAISAAFHFLVNLFLNFTGPGLIIKHWTAIVNFTRSAWNAVTGAVSSAWHAVTGAISSGIGAAINLVKSLPGRILSALGNLGSVLWGAGRSMIQGLINGAGSLLRNIGSFFLNLLPGWIVGPFKWALGIHSPSKVFHGFGANIGQGLIDGMGAMQPAVAAQMAALADTQSLAGLGAGGGAPIGGSVRTPRGAVGSAGGINYDRLAAAFAKVADRRPTVGTIVTQRNETGYELAERLSFAARSAVL